MKKKCLFIVSELPFPSRNGVTIPTSNYIKLIHSIGYSIDLIIIGNTNYSLESKEYCDFINKTYIVKTKKNKLKSIYQEIIKVKPFFNNYTYEIDNIYDILKKNGSYQMLVSSPINTTELALNILNIHQEIFKFKPFSIAGISDCYTSVLKTPMSINNNFKNNIRKLIRSYRANKMANMEFKILNHFDRIFVQTNKDAVWIKKISQKRLNSKVEIFTNGVDESLFNINQPFSKNFIFVGSLKSIDYQNNLLWIYKNIWKVLIKEFDDLKLYVYTGGYLPQENFQKMINDKTIIFYNDFVEDIKDVYQDKAICFAPIFKDYGFINKVAEAMTTGLVVVGDASAFNGITGIKDGENVLISKDIESFLRNIRGILKDETKYKEISKNAKNLAIEEFRWINKVNHFIINQEKGDFPK
jgi:glycosyltransferase involved in cell wall biosynthesis